MKQGRASSSGPGNRKIEPRGQSYTPGVVSQIGEALGNHATDTGKILHGASAPMYADKHDPLAPKMTTTTYHGGSQRRSD